MTKPEPQSSTTDDDGAVAAPQPRAEGRASRSSAPDAPPSTELVTEQGRTIITDTVVAKIAGTATMEIDGVHSLGGGSARVVGALRERIPGGRVNHSQGVAVEVGERQTAVDIGIIADYGVAIDDLAAGIRRNVIDAVERMTGLEVVEVNVTVYDVHLYDDDDTAAAAGAPSRVQ